MPPPATPAELEQVVRDFTIECWQNENPNPEEFATDNVSAELRGEAIRLLRELRSRVSGVLMRVGKAFSDEWKAARKEGKPLPKIETVLQKECRPNDPPEKGVRLLIELLKREFRLLQSQGLLPQSEAYRKRFAAWWSKHPTRLEECLQRYSGEFAERFNVTLQADGKTEVQLGKGGQAEVLLGYDTLLERHVAIKRLRSEDDPQAGQDAALRLRKEAKTLARLTDSDESAAAGVPAPYGFGHDRDGRLCLAMRVIRRANATRSEFSVLVADFHAAGGRATRRNTALLDLLARFADVCRVVEAAHTHPFGILHRDLKPNNILVDDAGRVFVADWGLALWVNKEAVVHAGAKEADGEMTARTVGGGTNGFMSPEQARDEVDTLGVPSDVFNLGACLFHLLTHRRVYDCVRPWWAFGRTLLRVPDDTTLLRARGRVYRRAPDPRAVNPTTDPELCDIVRKAIAPNANDRYKSAAELATAIDLWRGDKPQAKPSAAGWFGRRQHALARAVRRYAGWVFLFLLQLAVAAGGVWVWWAFQSDAATARARSEADAERDAAKADNARRAREAAKSQCGTLQECTRLLALAHTPGAIDQNREELAASLNRLLDSLVAAVRDCRLDLNHPEDAKLAHDLADARLGVGKLLHAKGQFEKAVAVFNAGLRETPDTLPLDRAELHFELGRVMSVLGLHHWGITQFTTAESFSGQLPDGPERDVLRARVLGHRGDSFVGLKRWEAAGKDYRESLRLRQGVADARRKDPAAKLQLAYGHANLARLEGLRPNAEGDSAQMLRSTDDARKLFAEVIDNDPNPALVREASIGLATCLINLGEGVRAFGRPAPAGCSFRAAELLIAPVHAANWSLNTGLLLLRARIGRLAVAKETGRDAPAGLWDLTNSLFSEFKNVPEQYIEEQRREFERLPRTP